MGKGLNGVGDQEGRPMGRGGQYCRRNIFAGTARARRAGPDSMLILCVSVCVSEIISRTLIGRKTRTSLRGMSSTKATYLLQQENKTNNERLNLAVLHSDLIKLSLIMSNNILKPELLTNRSCCHLGFFAELIV